MKSKLLALLLGLVLVSCSGADKRLDESMALAETAVANGQIDVAYEYAEPVYDARPDDPAARLLIAKIHRAQGERASEAGEFAEAAQSFALAGEREPYRQQRAADYYQAWLNARDAGVDAADAIEYLDAALVADPTNLDARMMAATAHDELGNARSAIEHYMWVWEADRTQTPIGLRLGSLYLQEKEYDDAEAIFRRIIERDSSHVQAHLQLAEVYEAKGRRGRAKSLYQQLVTEYPENPAVMFRYADFLERGGQTKEAARVRARARGELPGVKRRKMRRLR